MAFPIPILDLLTRAVDKIFPDANQRQQTKLQLQQLAHAGELDELHRSYDAIVAEAQSADKWTSRARPSFMYVMYVMFLVSIPFGVWFAVHPESANNFSLGVKAWFQAIPSEMYTLFGVGYVGYSASRSYDKMVKLKHG